MVDKIIIVFVGLMLVVLSVEATKCYQCTSTNEGPCFEPGEQNVTSVTCLPATDEFSCFYTKITKETTGNIVVKRDCVKTMLADQYCEEFEDEGITGEDKYVMSVCEVCGDDLCNSGERIVLVSTLSCLSVIFLLTLLI